MISEGVLEDDFVGFYSCLYVSLLINAQLLKEKGLVPEIGQQVENIVCALDPDLQGAAAGVATILRGKGQSVDLVLENKPLKWCT